ncbi:hypothetical protein R3P38DRAFT_3174186 [Favolaschia claudopus]|uniref:Uncharacterized protein n=1 Tax=Favolaschia claudopus TaxID=2862362 RepID=A0AAW0DHQ3_9AGAR
MPTGKVRIDTEHSDHLPNRDKQRDVSASSRKSSTPAASIASTPQEDQRKMLCTENRLTPEQDSAPSTRERRAISFVRTEWRLKGEDEWIDSEEEGADGEKMGECWGWDFMLVTCGCAEANTHVRYRRRRYERWWGTFRGMRLYSRSMLYLQANPLVGDASPRISGQSPIPPTTLRPSLPLPPYTSIVSPKRELNAERLGGYAEEGAERALGVPGYDPHPSPHAPYTPHPHAEFPLPHLPPASDDDRASGDAMLILAVPQPPPPALS